MTDTIDRLVRILDEEREARRKAEQDRTSANYALMSEQGTVKVLRQELKNRDSDLDIAEAKIKEWISYAEKLLEILPAKKHQLASKRPARYYRSDIPF